jgi:hypothetical protein
MSSYIVVHHPSVRGPVAERLCLISYKMNISVANHRAFEMRRANATARSRRTITGCCRKRGGGSVQRAIKLERPQED